MLSEYVTVCFTWASKVWDDVCHGLTLERDELEDTLEFPMINIDHVMM